MSVGVCESMRYPAPRLAELVMSTVTAPSSRASIGVNMRCGIRIWEVGGLRLKLHLGQKQGGIPVRAGQKSKCCFQNPPVSPIPEKPAEGNDSPLGSFEARRTRDLPLK